MRPRSILECRRMFRYLLFSLLLLGCVSSQVRVTEIRGNDTTLSGKVEPQARTLFYQAERAFLARDYEKALRGFHTVRTKYTAARTAIMLSSYRIGASYYYQEAYEPAIKEFESFLARYPTSDLGLDVRYNLAACEYQLGHYEKAGSLLSAFKSSDIRGQGLRRAEIIYQLVALTSEALGNHPAAVAAYANEALLPLDEKKRDLVYTQAEATLGKIDSSSKLEQLLAEVTEPVVRARITARMALLSGSATPTMATAPTPIAGNISAPEISGSSSSLPLVTGTRAERTNVGVVLPLSGEMARYGQRALEGILLAAELFQSNRSTDIRLFVEDTQSNPEVARRAVETLFHRDSVVGILGPLSWNEAIAVAEKAQSLGVFNLSLTGKEGVSSRGAYLFQNALTPAVQLESLVEHCVKEEKFKRFAILAPDNAYGKDMASEFWNLVEKNNGRIVSYKTYAPDEKDFQEYIQRMVGLASPKFRKMELEKLAEFKKETKERTGREPKADLPPIIDFDAIFLPDSPATVAQIAASLAYYDVTGVTLLGTTEWNSDQLYKRGGRYVEGALFPGGLHADSANENQRKFFKLFSGAYGSSPDLLAAQSYEAMQILESALKATASSDRNEVVREVGKLAGFTTPLGSLTFDPNRIARRRLAILKLDDHGNIIER